MSKIKEDLFEKILEHHSGLYIFTPEFWKQIYKLRTQLNYQPAILEEIPQLYKLSEKQEIELITQLVKEAHDRKKITAVIDLQTEQLKKYMKENRSRKQRAWMNEFSNP